MSVARHEPIDVAPFLAWAAQREAHLARQQGSEHGLGLPASEINPIATLIREIGWDEQHGPRRLYRWRHENTSGVVQRADVEDALHHAGVLLHDVYPALDEPADANEAYCTRCHDTVTAIDDVCPWCDTPISGERQPRVYCPREDAMSYPLLNGDCWRCGSPTRPDVPWTECGCGCGTLIHRFDRWGREIRWAVGHAPRAQYDAKQIDAGPFADWLLSELRNLDPIQALTRRVGLKREQIIDLLEHRSTTIDLAAVRTSLWKASREGQGKGMPPRPGAMTFAELYPEHVRSRTCEKCGGGKAPHAEMCKACRRRQRPGRRPRPSSITEPLILEAKRIFDDGATVLAAARVIQPRTRCTNVESIQNELLRHFRQRGWPTRHPSAKAAA